MDEAAARQDVEEIGLVGAHRSGFHGLLARSAANQKLRSPLAGRWCNRSPGAIQRNRHDGVARDRADERHLDGRRGRRLIDTDGETIAAFGPTGYRPYADAERALLRQRARRCGSDDDTRPASGRTRRGRGVDRRGAHAEAVEALRAEHAIRRGRGGRLPRTDRAASAGRRAHRADRRRRGARTALGLPVVYDLRAADLQAGGQGAPLVPVFHRALMRSLTRPRPVAVLNVGGVANVTYIDGERPDRVRHRTRQCADRRLHARANRTHARRRRTRRGCGTRRRGRAGEAAHASFLRAASAEIARPQRFPRMGRAARRARSQEYEDGAATLTALTAATAARIVAQLPRSRRRGSSAVAAHAIRRC